MFISLKNNQQNVWISQIKKIKLQKAENVVMAKLCSDHALNDDFQRLVLVNNYFRVYTLGVSECILKLQTPHSRLLDTIK